VREFTVEAKNLRGVIKEMDRLYPGLGEHLVEETTVAIDGAIHETAYFQPIRERLRGFFHTQARRRVAYRNRLANSIQLCFSPRTAAVAASAPISVA
jgi:molybdopterin synthase sulfur carrier subunit